ncbi:SDR family NAD(P)-dependent oxidoreductase, partial [Bosea sp. (in: a-proteobacteria)]|uniref:SDR family NAD(P)-dependent oxidoreductase n=1 Tax=Bosea sp. (in: a-proteobacteria) TaxID=1871050 RepID=UPI003F6EB8BB
MQEIIMAGQDAAISPFRLEGQVAVITGAARGIGRRTAELFVANGAQVVLLDRDEAEAAGAAQSIGAGAGPNVAKLPDETHGDDPLNPHPSP